MKTKHDIFHIGDYVFTYNKKGDCFQFGNFEVYIRFRYGFLLYHKGSDNYICCNENYENFCKIANRYISLDKLT